MNTPADIDIGPLTWVKGEIDLALERAGEALQAFDATPGDSSQLKFAQTHLHQAHGALAIVGLDGITQFSDALEQLLIALEGGATPYSPAVGQTLQQGLAAIRQYLDDLVSGLPNQPLKLFPAYQGLLAARGVTDVTPSDLFFPDLSLRPPRREKDLPARSQEALALRLKAARLGFQRGLLKWLRGEHARGGIEMRNSVAVIELTQNQPGSRAFWWIAQAYLDALSLGGIDKDDEASRMCGRIDGQIRKMLEGTRAVPDRLLRDLLYFVATAGKSNDHIQCVRGAYGLADLVPSNQGPTSASAPILRALRELLGPAKDDWNRFAAGTASALPQFHERVTQIAAQAKELGQVDLARLTAAIATVANLLRKDPLRHNEGVSLEIATALLLSDNAVENYAHVGADLGTEFAHQVDVMTSRLGAQLKGEAVAALEVPHLDEISRRASERLLMSQVAKEIHTSLAQVEQTLDTFFRDPSQAGELPGLAKPIKQIEGALYVLGEMRAVEVLQECNRRIAAFAAPGYMPKQVDFEDVASKLSALGFFIEAIQHGPADLDAILNPPRPTAPPAEEEEALPDFNALVVVEVAPAAPAPTSAPTIDAAVAKEALSVGGPAFAQVAESVIDQQISAMAGDLSIAMADLAPAAEEAAPAIADVAPPPILPSAEATRLADASSEEIDAELLEIFIEEAHEVIGTIQDNLPRVEANPHDKESLTTVRRSFHTLKGSGRMVGLTDLGETAWAVEQVMNRWLQLERDATPPLLAMLHQALDVFTAWVAQLEAHGGASRDASALVAVCTALKSDEESPDVAAAPIAAVPVAEPALEIAPEIAPEPALEFEQPDAPEAVSPAPVEALLEGPDVLEFAALEADVVTAPELQPEEEPTAEEIVSELVPLPDFESLEMPELAAEELDIEPAAPEALEEITLPSETEAAANIGFEEAPSPAPVEAPVAEAPVSLGDVTLSPALYRMYLDEVRGHLATLKQERDILGRLQTPPSHQSIRAAHTFASTSATVGIKPPHALAHALEMALVRIGAAEVTLTPAQLQLLDETLVALDGMLAALGAAQMPEAAPELAARLADLRPEVMESAPTLPAEPVIEALEAPEAPAEVTVEEPVFEFAALTEQPAPVAATSTAAEVAEAQQSANRRQQRIQDDLDPQLVPLFLEEADELMAQVGPDLRAWRGQLGDAAIAGRLQRIFHTLKGSARMAGAMGVGELIHSMETRVDNAMAAHAVTPQLIDDLEVSFDRAQFLVDKIRGGDAGEEAAEESTAADVQAPASAAAAPAAPAPVAIDLAAVERSAEPESQAARAVLRVQAELMDRLVNEAGELAIARSRIEGEMRSLKTSLLDLTENVMRLRGQLREIEIQAESQMQSHQAEAAEKNRTFDPLEMDRFTRFQELTRMMAESVNDVTTVQHNLLRNLDHADAALAAQARLNRELSQALMGVRMVPFNTLAERLHRIVRQTAKETDRRANLDIRGGQTELDRSVLEKITGPLEHLLRNAVSHGIEPVSGRGSKDPMGQITLALAQEGNEIRIELQDDGTGLDLAKIRAKAESRGLLSPGQAIDEAQLIQFIFMAGFSTADKLTEVSGRGVGMDVVKTETAALGGRIEVHSTPGQGSTFRIYLPLTLAVTQAVLVKSGNRTYAIPSTMVEQVSELKPEAVQRIRDEGGTDWLGTHYTYYYMTRLLGEPDAQPQVLRRHWIMLLKSGAGRIAVEVDALTGNQEIVVKNIGPQLARVVGIAGATVLGDGQVALILNPIALAGRDHVVDIAAGSAVTEAVAPTTVPTVLVVDDSLTVRKITGRLLAREGYHVVTAKDGVDALEQLIDLRPAVILSDIEMPRMDGFDLVRNIRADAAMKDIPVIMITSRIADKHKQYAKEIGADHYLGKPYDEDELLGLIAGYAKK